MAFRSSDASGALAPKLRPSMRIALAAVGGTSWALGGASALTGGGEAGAAALVLAGAATLAAAAVGRWPSKIGFAGGGVEWQAAEVVEQSLAAAREGGEDPSTVRALEVVLDRLIQVERTGRLEPHPAEQYDTEVAAAFERLRPDATIMRNARVDRSAADFIVRTGSSEAYVETKWRADPFSEYRGSTLHQLTAHLPDDAKLLVVCNSPIAPKARARISDQMGNRASIVTWRSVQDDPALKAALMELLL